MRNPGHEVFSPVARIHPACSQSQAFSVPCAAAMEISSSFDKCRKTTNDALKMDPTNANLRVLSAKIAIEQGQLEAAERELELAQDTPGP